MLGQGEEMAFIIGLDEGQEVKIEKVYQPRGGLMTAEKIIEAYVAASDTTAALKSDKIAVDLFEGYRGQNIEDIGGVPHKVFANILVEPVKRYKGLRGSERTGRTWHSMSTEVRCDCAQGITFAFSEKDEEPVEESVSVFAGKKYKPVGLKVRPVYTELPEQYRIKREIKGDPLANLPALNPNPPEFQPEGRYTTERKEDVEERHGDFLWPEEMKCLHDIIRNHEQAFAWNDDERGSFRKDFFPPIEFPLVEHEAWVERSIPIPRGQLEEFCKIIKKRLDAGVYEPSNASYRSKFFGVLKKDGKSIRLVHALEPLNAVTIAHSGVPPATEELANHFAGRACGGCLDLFSGYNHRDIGQKSRDFTTFQTPFGALRLVKLPQGWTNSVPIFHDDVTYILQDEIPHVTMPYIDDVPIRGPGSRYELPEGGCETIAENSGIRRFIWEYFSDLNRIIQRMKYSGGTFSGAKSVLCAEEFFVVGHMCSFEGRRPDTDRIGVILRWPPLKDVSEVRQFLGTVGVMRMFIRDYAALARPIQKLTRKDEEFEWGEKQVAAMEELKIAVRDAPCLKPLNYEWDSDIVLAVDTSWMAVGIQIYQTDPNDSKRRYYAKFASITLNRREAEFSQPKRELYGLKRALEAMQYWLLGCRRLVVEMDAKYIQGMLNNPGMGPNATINRWIEQILMFKFRLKHTKGVNFPPDGLSRRTAQLGDEEWPRREDDVEPNGPPSRHEEWDYFGEQPLELEEFQHEIDTRGGYLQKAQTATDIRDFDHELNMARSDRQLLTEYVKKSHEAEQLVLPVYLQASDVEAGLLPDEGLRDDETIREPYNEERRSAGARNQDASISLIKDWLKDTLSRPAGMEDEQKYRRFVHYASRFFQSEEGKLYRREKDSPGRLVVQKQHRMYMMRAAHDALGHRGGFATTSLLEQRFWWPDIEGDVRWYIKSCHLCQKRKLAIMKTPPVISATPSIFKKIHTDVMHMSESSNQCSYIVDARCALSRFPEARGLREQTAKNIGLFLLEDIICRWGCPTWIVTDNGTPFIAAMQWLKDKYGIKGIKVSPYHSQSNGVVERGHWDLRQSLYKATGGNLHQWFYFLHQVLWADRITIRRGMGCSPYFAVCGSHPVLPLDVAEATWMAEYPDRIISMDELIGLRARALAKHTVHIEEMRSRMAAIKTKSAEDYAEKYKHVIKDYEFKPGDVVLVRNTVDEGSLSGRNRDRWWGPLVVVRRTKGGAYIVCEFNGAVWQKKIGKFRVIPYQQRRRLTIGPHIERLIDVSQRTLDELESEPEPYHGKDLQFDQVKLQPSQDSWGPNGPRN
jgi:hypothetical protein